MPSRPIDQHLNHARASFDGATLTIASGPTERTWRLTPNGFVTTGLRRLPDGRSWCRPEPVDDCDWRLPGLAGPTAAELQSIDAAPSDDEGFTSEHLRIAARFTLPEARVELLWECWAYASGAGLRARL